jgi:hypothetical protein
VRTSASATGTRKIVPEKQPIRLIQKPSEIFLDLEQRWLSLARSFEFSERITGFEPAEPEPVPGS